MSRRVMSGIRPIREGNDFKNQMCYRACKLDVAHTLTTNFGQGYLNTTLLADDATMLEALVLAAEALVVLHRAKDLGAKQTITLGLEGSIVDGFGFFTFKGPRSNHLR